MNFQPIQLFGEGVRRTNGNHARRYNLLPAKLIAELIKNCLGPCGLEKMFIDILGEATITKDGATILRKLDVEHPAAKVLIEASNAVDNEVGDGTTSVVVLAGALIEKAEELLDLGIAPATIQDGFGTALEYSLQILQSVAQTYENSDKEVMKKIASTCMESKSSSYAINAKLVVDAIYAIADFTNNRVEADNIKVEEKLGNISDTQLVNGIVLDKTIDSSAMPKMIEHAFILLINEDLEGKRTRTDAEINITSPERLRSFTDKESLVIKSKVQNIIDSGANVVISQKGISLLAQYYLGNAGIISIRRVKENDLLWIEKATGARIIKELYNISRNDLGYAGKVYEKIVGDEKMVFVEECKNPKSVAILLRSNSKKSLDQYHRAVLDTIAVLRDFIIKPSVVAGGGSTEVIIANKIRSKSNSVSRREQIVIQKFADALEEIPLTIARNAGMNLIDTLVQLRSSCTIASGDTRNIKWYGIDAIGRKITEMFSQSIIEPSVVKEQILKTAVEVTNLLIRVDDVLMAKPTMYTHTHRNGLKHSHRDGDKKHDHYFDKLGKQQRPMHHYY